MNRRLLHQLKRAAYRLTPDPWLYRQGTLPNLMLFSSRRGGSTHLAEVIAAEPGMRYVDQPFDLFRPASARGLIKARYLPPKAFSQFIDLTEEEARLVERYIGL